MSSTKLLIFSLITALLFVGSLEAAARLTTSPGCGSAAALDAWYRRDIGAQPGTAALPMPYDPDLMWSPLPNYQGFDTQTVVRHNSRGLRSPEIPLDKPLGTARVLLLGDSSIYGHGVVDEQALRGQLEAALRRTRPFIDVINAGVPGYSSLQSLHQLARLVPIYQPDVVVIANLWSDLTLSPIEDKVKMYGHGIRAIATRLDHWADRSLAPRSALYCALKGRFGAGDGGRTAQLNRVYQPGPHQPQGFNRVGLEDYSENLKAMVNLIRGAGAEPAFLALADRTDLGLGQTAAGADPEPRREAMRAAAASADAPLVDAVAIFREAASSTTSPLFIDVVHPTATGHTLIAHALADALLGDPDIGPRLESP